MTHLPGPEQLGNYLQESQVSFDTSRTIAELNIVLPRLKWTMAVLETPRMFTRAASLYWRFISGRTYCILIRGWMQIFNLWVLNTQADDRIRNAPGTRSQGRIGTFEGRAKS